ncbi:hypothetical protein, partial [Salmonella sp. s51933]|uniref:hypothetical protein n=1 Tax=Salmonella sp. s51933 TaxID=3160127 RepID=UPI00375455BC
NEVLFGNLGTYKYFVLVGLEVHLSQLLLQDPLVLYVLVFLLDPDFLEVLIALLDPVCLGHHQVHLHQVRLVLPGFL